MIFIMLKELGMTRWIGNHMNIEVAIALG